MPASHGGGRSPDRRVAIYVRVSTSSQADRDSLPMQRRELEAYSDLVLGIPDHEVFEDAGYSGKNVERPAFQRMMARVRRLEFSHVLVWKIDRISRNLLDFSNMYEELRELRVTFVSKNEQFDTSTAMGEAMLKIILVFAELERNMTSERVTATMISRASQGQWNGGRVPYGYDYNSDTGEFSIREDEAEVCRMIRDDYLSSRSLLHTARMLNSKGLTTRSGAEWSPTTVWGVASSPFHAGTYRYNRLTSSGKSVNPEDEWVVVNGHHPAIYTEAEHEEMLSVLSENGRNRNAPGGARRSRHAHVFAGLCRCAKCGSMMVASSGRACKDGYVSSSYSCPKRRAGGQCSNRSVSEADIGEFVLNYVLNVLRAGRDIRSLGTDGELSAALLDGMAFSGITGIGKDGLDALRSALSSQPAGRRRAHKPKQDDGHASREIARQERALERLQSLYLYSDSGMSEREFVARKGEISKRIEELKGKGDGSESKGGMTDEAFVEKASSLLIAARISEKRYVYYRGLARDVSPDVLKAYMQGIVSRIDIDDGKVVGITFRNGLSQSFVWAK